MRVTAAAATDVGRVRAGNEDAFLNEAPLFAVADGIGGHQGGEVASQLALQTLKDLFEHGHGTLAQQVREANRAVFERSSRDAAVAGMGTTLTAAVAEAGRLRLAHVGDSRAYLLRDGELRMLTEDHTLVHRLVAEGEISEREAEVHPHRSVLTRALGTAPDVQIDEAVIDARDGDRLLLCSDGLTGMVPHDRIAAILREAREPKDAVKQLVRAANAEGGVDNITVLVLDISLDPESDGSGTGASAATATGPASQAPGASTRSAGRARAPRRVVAERHRGARRAALWAIAAVLLVVVGVFGLRFYLDQQWYVGDANGRVAVFRGVPSELLGFQLHRAIVVTSLSAPDAMELPFYGGLAEGITAESRPAADAIVAQIAADLRERQAALDRAQRRAERERQRRRERRRERARNRAQQGGGRNAA